MSKGFVVLAQNTTDVNYVQQAYALALSIKRSQHTVTNISIVTNDPVPKKYKKVFDQVIEIPWVENVVETRYRAENRWKLYHVTPYEETIVLDTDMLVLEDISTWWDQCKNYDINFCSRVKTHKLEVINDTFYRKPFRANSLTNPYFALHYFKKSDAAYNFYKVLEFVCNNWEWCWTEFAPVEYQDWLSMDLAAAIAIEITGMHEVVNVCSPLEFIHMKPKIQDWEAATISWQDAVPFVLNTRGELIVGNIKQSKIFHYVEKSFLTERIVSRLEELNRDNT